MRYLLCSSGDSAGFRVCVKHDVSISWIVVEASVKFRLFTTCKWIADCRVASHPLAKLHNLRLVRCKIDKVLSWQGGQHIEIIRQSPVHPINPYISRQIWRINQKHYSRHILKTINEYFIIARSNLQSVEIVGCRSIIWLANMRFCPTNGSGADKCNFAIVIFIRLTQILPHPLLPRASAYCQCYCRRCAHCLKTEWLTLGAYRYAGWSDRDGRCRPADRDWHQSYADMQIWPVAPPPPETAQATGMEPDLSLLRSLPEKEHNFWSCAAPLLMRASSIGSRSK